MADLHQDWLGGPPCFDDHPRPPLVSLDDPDLTRAVAEAIDLRWQRRTTFGTWPQLAQDAAEAALAAVRAHLDGVGRVDRHLDADEFGVFPVKRREKP